MTLYGRSTRWAAALALGLAGLLGMGAATVSAVPAARTAPSAFELTLEAELMPPFFMSSSGGTFRSRAPFCAAGTFVEDSPEWLGDPRWRFTCDDGTGSLTFLNLHGASWRILDGSGRYEGLRGRISLRGEQLCGNNCDLQRPIPWRGTFQGVVDWDAVAPTITLSSATATKLRHRAGAYALRLRVALRDDVADNPVSYTVRASARGVELARRDGTARTEAVSMTLRIWPPTGARTVRLRLSGVDPVGNTNFVGRTLRLPR